MPLSPGHGQAGRGAVPAASPPRQPGTPLALPKRLIKGICGAAEPGCNLALTVHLFQRLRQPGELVGSLITGRQAAGAAGRRNSCGRRAGGPRAASAERRRCFPPWGPGRRHEPRLSQQPCHSSLVTAALSQPADPRPGCAVTAVSLALPPPSSSSSSLAGSPEPAQPRSPPPRSSRAGWHRGCPALGARTWLCLCQGQQVGWSSAGTGQNSQLAEALGCAEAWRAQAGACGCSLPPELCGVELAAVGVMQGCWGWALSACMQLPGPGIPGGLRGV